MKQLLDQAALRYYDRSSHMTEADCMRQIACHFQEGDPWPTKLLLAKTSLLNAEVRHPARSSTAQSRQMADMRSHLLMEEKYCIRCYCMEGMRDRAEANLH